MGIRGSACAACALVILLLAPSAAAVGIVGSFSSAEPVALRAGSAHATLEGAVLRDASGLAGFSFLAGQADLCWYQVAREHAAQQWLDLAPSSGCSRETDVSISLGASSPAGWIGLAARGGDAALAGGAPWSLSPGAGAFLSDAPRPRQPDAPDDVPAFSRNVPGPLVTTSSSGSLDYEGGGALKIMGLDVVVASAQNVTEYRTGRQLAGGAMLGAEQDAWLVVAFDAGTVRLVSNGPSFALAARDVRAPSASGLDAPSANGTLVERGVTYALDPRAPAQLEGVFAASLAPTPAGDALRVDVQGDALTLGPLAALAAEPTRGAAMPWLLVVGGVAIVGGAGFLALRRRGPLGARRAARDLARRGLAFADHEQWDLAATFYERAVAREPACAAIWQLEAGVARFMQTRYADAMTLFERAAEGLQDGEAEVWAADCAIRLGHEDHAETLLLRALDRPRVHADVLTLITLEEEFRALLDREAVRAAMEAAAERVRA
ncbi:MAG: hypothetical protein QOE90_3418 [Thermoplasmata archaeon]|jgi:hypothetical protein|nr:hypothetical protein [Thermoplasmata archaeon]